MMPRHLVRAIRGQPTAPDDLYDDDDDDSCGDVGGGCGDGDSGGEVDGGGDGCSKCDGSGSDDAVVAAMATAHDGCIKRNCIGNVAWVAAVSTMAVKAAAR